MTDALVDTSVVIDLMRNFSPAVAWLQAQPPLSIPRVVVLEIIDGAGNKRDLARSLKFLDTFIIIPMTDNDVMWAVQQLGLVRLSHNVDPMDAMIAAVSYRLQVPLYTRNLKHFAPMIPQLAAVPY